MFLIQHVQDVQRISSNEFIIVYGSITITLTKYLSGWTPKFKAVVQGCGATENSKAKPAIVYHDSEVTAEDREFWAALVDAEYVQRSDAYDARRKRVCNVINFLEKNP